MILDSIENRATYYGLGEDIRCALDWLAAYENRAPKKEDLLIPGTDILVRIRPCDTKPRELCPFEAHRDYLDIHYVAEGLEAIGVQAFDRLKQESYDESADAYALSGEGDLVTLPKGSFLITYPQDAHQPCVAVGKPAFLHKLIVKIRV